LFIRVEADGKKGKDVCAITLANPEELHAFFKGLRQIVEALGHNLEPMWEQSVCGQTSANRGT